MRALLPFLLLFSFMVAAQTVKKQEIDIEDFVLKVAPVTAEGSDISEWIENLYALYQNPLDLNIASEDDLKTLMILNDADIKAIMNHRQTFGNFVSLYELQSVSGLNEQKIQQILPFLGIKVAGFNWQNIGKKVSEHYLVLRVEQNLESSKGFETGKFEGSRQKIYTRYRLNHAKDYSIGFLSEKDAGEKSLIDHTAFHFQIQNKGFIKNLVLGDFSSQFGQGLILSGGYAPGKSSEPIYGTRRNNLGYRPYNSLLETTAMRGMSMTIKLKELEISPLISINRKDASISDEASEDRSFSSFGGTGLHRTSSEIARKRTLNEQNIGLNLQFKKDYVQLGFTVLHTSFNSTLIRSAADYNYWEFSGKSNTVAGPNININWQNFSFFGEAAQSSSGGKAYFAGLIGALSPKVEWASNIRNYEKSFHSFYGSGLAEGSRSINERGIYNGIKYLLKKSLQIGAYYDRFKFPFLRYQVDAPSAGDDYQLRIDYKPSRKAKHYVVIHHENKQKNSSNKERRQNYLIETDRTVLSIGSEYVHKLWLKSQTKALFNNFATSEIRHKYGLGLIQDLEARFRKHSIKSRIAYYNTDGYDTRIYAYENDVLYALSFPAYYGKGMRYYLLSKISLTNDLDVWVRWAQTKVYDRENIGSGLDAIGDRKNDVKVQLKYNF